MIVKRAGKYVVVSDTLAEAKKRLQQIEVFKHLRARGAARRSRRVSA